MPRTARASVGGVCYHVCNRGNGRATVFHKDQDYEALLALIAEAQQRTPMRVLGYCLMPNHFHLILWPHGDGDLSRWMQWLMTSHVRRYHRHYHGSGHVWQGRFKAFPIQPDAHLLTVLRYVERNALRANLVRRAERWIWGSLAARLAVAPAYRTLLSPGPINLPTDWAQRVHEPHTPAELESLRRCIARGAPYGHEGWASRTALDLGIESSLNPRGRPRKKNR